MRSETDFWKIDEEEWIDFLQNPNKALSGDFFLENIVLFRLFFNFVYFYLEIVEEDDEEWIMVDFFTESKQGFIR